MELANKQRISSIDALRAFALLGILIIHTSQLFNYNNEFNDLAYLSLDTSISYKIIHRLFINKFRIIFSILFGISFYLILRNPNYSSRKFIIRSTLLICIGIINKFFYTTDVLFMYGICGIILTFFRKSKTNRLLYYSIALYVLYLLCIDSNLNTTLWWGERNFHQRYIAGQSLVDNIGYPIFDAISDYSYIIINNGIFETLSYFLFGYYLGRKGLIERIDKLMTVKVIVILSVLCLLSNVAYINTYHYILRRFNDLITAITYSAIFIFIYNLRNFPFLEKYGKLGLTNYSLMNLIGVAMTVTLFLPCKFSFECILLSMIGIYVLQILFSVIWLKYHKFGPLEYIWRRLTNILNGEK